ncbi:MAG: CTP synthase, partial [Treponema sp.]|nr:CTP synthase [Treponema sp.]
EAPLKLHENGLDRVVCRELRITPPEPDLKAWREMTEKISLRKKEVKIAIVGKYIKFHDAYLSLIESLNHAGFETGAFVKIEWIDSEDLSEKGAEALLNKVNGVIIPGGFGDRGIEGKIEACRYARENDIPFLGICLGMQIAVIEFARNICSLSKANSTEFDSNTNDPVIHYMSGQEGKLNSGGTMRLGAYPCRITANTKLRAVYGTEEISERHRHRFEFNNDYRKLLSESGMTLCGTSPDGNLIEAVEIADKKFFIGVQFHPEFKSRPNRPHPIFLGLLKASLI